jgi:hypothetical protein
MKKWIASLVVLLLIVLTGCKAVDGVDLNQVMKNSMSLTSSEGSETYEIRFLTDDSVELKAEAKTFMELFSTVKLNLKEVKMQDREHVSVKGELVYTKGAIPFQINVEDQDIFIQVEGAKKPIVIHSGAVPGSEANGVVSEQLQEQMKQLSKKMSELTPVFASFLADNLPNPNRILKITDTTETIHSEPVQLKRMHAEVNGAELLGLVKQFLNSVLADEQGLKDLIGQVYDVFVPFVKEAIKAHEEEMRDNPEANLYMQYLDNKTLAVEFLYTTITGMLQQAVRDFDGTVAEYLSSDRGRSINELLTDKQTLKMDFYVDHDNMIRKSATQINIALSPEKTGGLKGIQIATTVEAWNLNKPVTIDQIDKTNGVAEFSGFVSMSPSKLLSSLDSKSQLYQLLKNDLKITKKDIRMVVDNTDSGDSIRPYNKNGNVMVPARFVVEQLDATVNWEEATNQVTITDELRGIKIVIAIGSQTASVNGVIKPLEAAPELTNGSTFVPVRFIAESLGATVGWDAATNSVIIQRD